MMKNNVNSITYRKYYLNDVTRSFIRENHADAIFEPSPDEIDLRVLEESNFVPVVLLFQQKLKDSYPRTRLMRKYEEDFYLERVLPVLPYELLKTEHSFLSEITLCPAPIEEKTACILQEEINFGRKNFKKFFDLNNFCQPINLIFQSYEAYANELVQRFNEYAVELEEFFRSSISEIIRVLEEQMEWRKKFKSIVHLPNGYNPSNNYKLPRHFYTPTVDRETPFTPLLFANDVFEEIFKFMDGKTLISGFFRSCKFFHRFIKKRVPLNIIISSEVLLNHPIQYMLLQFPRIRSLQIKNTVMTWKLPFHMESIRRINEFFHYHNKLYPQPKEDVKTIYNQPRIDSIEYFDQNNKELPDHTLLSNNLEEFHLPGLYLENSFCVYIDSLKKIERSVVQKITPRRLKKLSFPVIPDLKFNQYKTLTSLKFNYYSSVISGRFNNFLNHLEFFQHHLKELEIDYIKSEFTYKDYYDFSCTQTNRMFKQEYMIRLIRSLRKFKKLENLSLPITKYFGFKLLPEEHQRLENQLETKQRIRKQRKHNALFEDEGEEDEEDSTSEESDYDEEEEYMNNNNSFEETHNVRNERIEDVESELVRFLEKERTLFFDFLIYKVKNLKFTYHGYTHKLFFDDFSNHYLSEINNNNNKKVIKLKSVDYFLVPEHSVSFFNFLRIPGLKLSIIAIANDSQLKEIMSSRKNNNNNFPSPIEEKVMIKKLVYNDRIHSKTLTCISKLITKSRNLEELEISVVEYDSKPLVLMKKIFDLVCQNKSIKKLVIHVELCVCGYSKFTTLLKNLIQRNSVLEEIVVKSVERKRKTDDEFLKIIIGHNFKKVNQKNIDCLVESLKKRSNIKRLCLCECRYQDILDKAIHERDFSRVRYVSGVFNSDNKKKRRRKI